ncbi:MAG: SLC13 family permease [Candidatus Hinthialibacter sp.]
MASSFSSSNRLGTFLLPFLGGPLLFFILLWIPGPESLSPLAQRVAAVAAWMSLWWITGVIPVGATALIPFALFPFLGVMNGKDAVRHFAHDLNFLLMGGFMLAAAMERWNLHKRIGLAVIDWTGVTPHRIILGFMISTAFLSMWISNTATSLMMLPVALAVMTKIRETAGDEIGDRIAPALMLSIAYSASIGGVGTLIGTPPNAVFSSQITALYGRQIGFFDWLKIGLPMVIVILPMAWIYLVRFQFKLPSNIGLENTNIIREERQKLGPLSFGEWLVSLVFCFAALGWTFRKSIRIGEITIPGLQTLFPDVNTDATIAMIAALLLFALPVNIKKREFVLDLPSALKIPWDVLLIIGGGVCLAGGFSDSGLSEWIAVQMQFLADYPAVVIVLLAVGLVVFLTELTSNTATATIFMPIMGAIAVAIGQHPYLLMIPTCIGISMAFMLPAATPPNAVVYGSGKVSIQQMARTGFAMNLLCIVLITLFMFLLTNHLMDIQLNVIPPWAAP